MFQKRKEKNQGRSANSRTQAFDLNLNLDVLEVKVRLIFALVYLFDVTLVKSGSLALLLGKIFNFLFPLPATPHSVDQLEQR